MEPTKLIADELYDILGEILTQRKDIMIKVRELQVEKELLKSSGDYSDTLIIL